MSINPERLAFALRETTHKDGFAFEEFSNQFLVTEFPNLQPIGGMHDGGADGILYVSDSAPKTIIQSSVTAITGVDSKIKRTIKRLKEAGRECRELVYCSPLDDVTKATEELAKDLRKSGTSLLIRDAAYFSTFCNTSAARISAAESYFNKIGAPILTPANLASAQQIQLTTDEEKLLLIFFGATLANTDPEKSILQTSYETVVSYCLRETTASKCLSKEEILANARTIAQHDQDKVFNERVDGAITKLLNKGVVKFRSNAGYHLAHAEMERTTAALLTLHEKMVGALREMDSFLREIRSRLKLSPAIDEPAYAKTLLAIINAVLSSQSNTATLALAKGQFSSVEQDSLKAIVTEKVSTLALATAEKDPTIEFFVILVESIMQRPPPVIATYFRSVADAYFMFFLLRQPSEIQDALRKVIGHGKIVLDASILIPVLAEYAFAPDLRTRQNLLRAVIDAGASLYVADLGVTEIVTHMNKARAIHERISRGESHYGHSALVDAFYSKSNTRFKSFHDFLSYFSAGEAKHDIQEMLRIEFHIQPLEVAPVSSESVNKITSMTAVWRALRQKPAELDENDYSLLIQNDVRTYLHIKAARAKQSASEKSYGESWWWLTEDSTARSIDKSETAADLSVCMRPDYLLRYVSIMPRSRASDRGNQLAPLPISIEMAGLGLIPDEILAANAKSAEIADDEPVFRRQMKLRQYINKSRSS